MKRKLGFFVMGVLAGVSSYEAWAGFTLQGSVDATTTTDSKFRVEGTDVPQNYDKIRIDIQKTGAGLDAGRSYYPDSSPSFSSPIYLSFGSGDYHVQIWGCHALGGSFFCRSLSTLLDVQNSDTRDLTYLLPSGNMQSDSPEIITLAQSIVQNISDDRAKALAIHDWVANNIAADMEADDSGNFASTATDALSVLHAKKSLCEGISYLTGALTRAAGLRIKVISGAAAGQADPPLTASSPTDHDWNEVLLAGRWVTEDVTWDAGYVDATTGKWVSQATHQYFDPDPAFLAQSHRKDHELAE